MYEFSSRAGTLEDIGSKLGNKEKPPAMRVEIYSINTIILL